MLQYFLYAFLLSAVLLIGSSSFGFAGIPGYPLVYYNSTNYSASLINATMLNSTNSGSSGQVLSFNGSSGLFTWVTQLSTSGLDAAGVVAAVGNWSADKPSYNTTSQLNTLYYLLSNPSGFYNSTTIPSFGSSNLTLAQVVSGVGNWSADKSSYALNTYVASIGNWSGNQSSYSTTAVANGLYAPVGVGNWAGNMSSYSTTAAANLLYYPISTNPSGFYNTTTIPSYALNTYVGSLGNWSGNASNVWTKAGGIPDSNISSAVTWNSKGSSNLTISDISSALGNATAVNSSKALIGSSAVCTYGIANVTLNVNGVPTVTCAAAQGSSGNVVNYTTVTVYANSTTYNTTLVNRLTLAASSSYVITCNLITKSSVTTTGVQLRVNTTGTPTSVDISYAPYGSVLGYDGVSTSTNALNVLTGTVTYAPSVLTGYVVTQAASNSNWTIEMRSEIGTTNAWVVRGSNCQAVKVL